MQAGIDARLSFAQKSVNTHLPKEKIELFPLLAPFHDWPLLSAKRQKAMPTTDMALTCWGGNIRGFSGTST